MMEDAELLRRYAENRSEEAFAELVRRHLDFVYGVALRQLGGDAHQAQDVAQVVFTTLARKAAPLARRPVLGGWLYRTAQFTAIDVVRAETRRQLREQKAAIVPEPSVELGKAGEEELRSLLDRMMGELNETDRDAVWLRFFAGLPFEEVGARLRLTENAARMRVGRALEKMRVTLSRRGVTSTTAALAATLASQAGVAAPSQLAALVTAKAVAGTAAAGTGAVLAFMGMGKIFPVATAVLLIAGATFWQRQDNAMRLEHAANLALQREEIARLREENQGLKMNAAEIAVYREEHAELARLRDENEALKNRVSSAGEKSPGRRMNLPAGAIPVPVAPELAKIAEVAQRTAQSRRLIQQRYEAVFMSLGLSPEQREKLILLLVDDREAAVDFAAAAATTGQGVTGDQVAFANSVFGERQQIRSQIKDLLGEEGYAQFVAADEVVRQSSVIERLSKNLKGTGAALQPAQASLLLRALQEEKVHFVSSAVVARASEFLNPAQLTALQELQQRRELGAQKENIQQAVNENLPGVK